MAGFSLRENVIPIVADVELAIFFVAIALVVVIGSIGTITTIGEECLKLQ